jgi:hypothetical protein
MVTVQNISDRSWPRASALNCVDTADGEMLRLCAAPVCELSPTTARNSRPEQPEVMEVECRNSFMGSNDLPQTI